jgi:transcriptional regulator with XRE-family HTH domain
MPSQDKPTVFLKEWRIRKAMTQAELSKAAGLDTATISHLETRQRFPRPSTVRRLAQALKIRPDDLFRSP